MKYKVWVSATLPLLSAFCCNCIWCSRCYACLPVRCLLACHNLPNTDIPLRKVTQTAHSRRCYSELKFPFACNQFSLEKITMFGCGIMRHLLHSYKNITNITEIWHRFIIHICKLMTRLRAGRSPNFGLIPRRHKKFIAPSERSDPLWRTSSPLLSG